jgi:hypothetical protein
MSFAVFRPLLESLTKYWTVLIALCATIYWLGGFISKTQAIEVEQASLKLRIVEIEQRQDKLEDKINSQNLEVITRLVRMESTLEEIKRRK